MTDIHLEVSWINLSKAIMHGYIGDEEIELELNEEQKDLLYDLNALHQREREKLLKGFIND